MAERKVGELLDSLNTTLDVDDADMVTDAEDLKEAMQDLQEISSGLHPAILSRGGLAAALASLVRRFPMPVQLNVHVDERLRESIEIAI